MFMIFSVNVFAEKVILDAATKRLDLGLYADYLEDVDGQLDISNIVSGKHSLEWKKNTSQTLNFSFSDSVFWLRFDIQSLIPTDKIWLFELAFPLQDYIDYYVVDNGLIVSTVSTGDRRVFDTRQIDYRNFLFYLDLPARTERQVYVRLDTADGLHEPAPIILWDSLEFTTEHGTRHLGLGLYFGIMIVMALYNLFIYLSIRDKTYLYYVSYILFFSLWLFIYYGLAYQYFWPNSPKFANQAIIVSTSIWTIFMAFFVCSFLEVKKGLPWFDKIMKVYVVTMLITIAVSFTYNYSLGILFVVGFGTPAASIGIVAGIQSWRSGYGPARFFLLAWGVLLVSLIVFSLKISGLLPTVWVIERSVQIGSAIEVVLLSLGLADRINSLRKEKMAAQNQAIKSFESNMQLKNDFITSISHELRTPMNAIMGGVEVAKSNNEELDQPLKIIRSGANDMMRLVDDILIHTELQSGQINVKPVSSDVKASLKRLDDYYGELCREKGLEFSYELDDQVPDWIRVDPRKLTVILTKLLGNAVKFTDQGSVKISVTIDRTDDKLWLLATVSDTGPGIPQDKQSIIFDPFRQLEGGFTRRHTGIGIGLSICRRLAEMLSGSLTLQSKVEEGSHFTLRIPIEASEPQAPVLFEKLASPELPVLVVEDNVVNQKVIVKMLSKLGLTSDVANHGQEALELIAKHEYSLVLMDLQMPVMDGFCCTEQIRNSQTDFQNIPIIAVTANVMDQDKARCFELGMDDFLAKPLKLDVLSDSLSRHIQLLSQNH
ncbi:MAG: response regulator [Pseudomonadales bacterium]|nr:response regulator [Pseudomonadales bacterium]